MSAEVAIKLTGSEYRELVKAVEVVVAQREPRRDYVNQRVKEIRGLDQGAVTDEEAAEYERLRVEWCELDSFFRAKKAFFS